jgi:hypothetical protein
LPQVFFIETLEIDDVNSSLLPAFVNTVNSRNWHAAGPDSFHELPQPAAPSVALATINHLAPCKNEKWDFPTFRRCVQLLIRDEPKRRLQKDRRLMHNWGIQRGVESINDEVPNRSACVQRITGSAIGFAYEPVWLRESYYVNLAIRDRGGIEFLEVTQTVPARNYFAIPQFIGDISSVKGPQYASLSLMICVASVGIGNKMRHPQDAGSRSTAVGRQSENWTGMSARVNR